VDFLTTVALTGFQAVALGNFPVVTRRNHHFTSRM
jgi:hypothetical protein